MQDVLKILQSRRTSLRSFWSNPSLIGRGLFIFLRFLTSLILWSFVLLFTFSGALSLYIACVLGLCPSAFFNEMNYLSKKKKVFVKSFFNKYETNFPSLLFLIPMI
jgi:hypothetical protein